MKIIRRGILFQIISQLCNTNSFFKAFAIRSLGDDFFHLLLLPNLFTF